MGAEFFAIGDAAGGGCTDSARPGDELVIVGCLHKVVPTGARPWSIASASSWAGIGAP